MADSESLEWYVRHGCEERYLEYKSAMDWSSDVTKVAIAKAVMALSNLENGGAVVVGMREIERCKWEPQGVTDGQARSFNQDDMDAWINDHAYPAAQFSMRLVKSDGRQFVLIQVSEYSSVPVICHKPFTMKGSEELKRGAIYYRSNKKNESAPISSEEDMRELVSIVNNKRHMVYCWHGNSNQD